MPEIKLNNKNQATIIGHLFNIEGSSETTATKNTYMEERMSRGMCNQAEDRVFNNLI